MKIPVLWSITILLVLSNVHRSRALSKGAPPSTCSTLRPKHSGVVPQTSSHYVLMVAKTVVVQGRPLTITITSSLDTLGFKGFILQAQNPATRAPLGTFTTIPQNAQALNCSDGSQNTVTHTDPNPKKSIQFEWQAPSNYEGEVVFNATVVQDFSTFWVDIESRITVADHSADNSSQSKGISTTKSPRTTTTPEPFTPESVTEAAAQTDPIYDGCGSKKTCFGIPDGCVGMRTCQDFVSCSVGVLYEFEMKSDGSAYVAVGLSNDDEMGEDSVVECVHDEPGRKVNAYMSWNPSRSNTRLDSSVGIDMLNGTFVDGTVYCKFTRDKETVVMNRTYDLERDQYYLLLASGSQIHENNIGFHDRYLATGQSKYLSDVSGYTGASKLLLRLHGAFMIGAWIGAASLGILLARYFRQTWVGNQLCGKDLWFAWHRMLMVLTWCLTIAGFILIFVELEGWSLETNPHAILGVITTLLAFFQPIGAAFRPHPESARRPIFNWLHWLVGNVAHILAIVTIFFAGKLTKAELPEWLIWILVAYVAFHVCMHLILSIVGCISERQSGKRINSFPMKDITNSRTPLESAERKQDAPHSCFRKFLLAVYIVGILALSTVIIVIVVLAPIEVELKKLQRYISNN